MQGSAKVGAPGLTNFVTADAYHFCPSLPAAFTQPGASILADFRTLVHIQHERRGNDEIQELCPSISWHGEGTWNTTRFQAIQHHPLTAVGLVRLVRAVGLLVAPPVRRDAARVVELVLGARELAGITVGRG